MIRATLKWEGLKWLYDFRFVWLSIAACWAILLVMPIPREHWWGWIYGIAAVIIIGAGAYAFFGAVYMIIGYPFRLIFTEIMKHSVMERGSGRNYAMVLCTRLALNVLTFSMGIGVMWVALQIAQLFAAADIASWLQNFITEMEVRWIWGSMLIISLHVPLFFFMTTSMQTEALPVTPVKMVMFVICMFAMGFLLGYGVFYGTGLHPLLDLGVRLGFIVLLTWVVIHIQNNYGEGR
ncbi:MAG: hypothetical protein FWC16_10060 [Defluviitaleaceae bacterium]|nr:hypothetical protein [Defluviitaleaceae bacterium]MCL2275259.1 hypothetical protein [Defluviitaleaceae bacterium]